ncbi:MAG: succinate dehydrogenase assembly factor 2 [Proteobacteria bacterium]|nr:succinate dehydrogenase assembly factor 2 [Pseudomonadota bacterium]
MNKEILLKQLFYRSVHRGCKETDFLIGEYAKAKLTEISDLELFKNFLEEDDLKIYDWILAKSEAPELYLELIKNIREFHKI